MSPTSRIPGRGSFVLAPEGEGAGGAERPDEPIGDYTPPAWYTMQVGRKELWTGPGAPASLRELLKGESTPEPGTLTRPDASPEFNALARQVDALTQQVDQLTQLFQQVLEAVQKPNAS